MRWLKSTGLQYWLSPNQDATNESGFSGLPGGHRYFDISFGSFFALGNLGYWWSSDEIDTDVSWNIQLFWDSGYATRETISKHYGFSVRCLRD
jgi:uncharacterized protein (TIGR02145 family)